jgi:uncharacterized membrane protein
MTEKRNLEKAEPGEVQTPVRQVEVSTAQFHFGPIPPPEQLLKYNDAVSNGAERILTMAEKQATHRQSLETKVIEADVKRSYWGLVAGFTVTVLALSASTFLIYNGHDLAGASIFGASLVTIVIAFISGVSSRKKERERKFLSQQQPQQEQ